MSRLSGPEIRRQIEQGGIEIDPLDEDCFGPNSVDLHIGDRLCVYSRSAFERIPVRTHNFYPGAEIVEAIDSRKPPKLVDVRLQDLGDGTLAWLLMPGTLYLAKTKERIRSIDYTWNIDGRSSTGRLGIFTHITAGAGDTGWNGVVTLEMAVIEPVLIYPGQRLIQISFSPVVGEYQSYSEHGHYQDATDIEPSKPNW